MLGADRVIIRDAETAAAQRSRLNYLRFQFGPEDWERVEVELIPVRVEPSIEEECAKSLFGWHMRGDKGARYWIRDRVKIPRGCYPLRRRP